LTTVKCTKIRQKSVQNDQSLWRVPPVFNLRKGFNCNILNKASKKSLRHIDRGIYTSNHLYPAPSISGIICTPNNFYPAPSASGIICSNQIKHIVRNYETANTWPMSVKAAYSFST